MDVTLDTTVLQTEADSAFAALSSDDSESEISRLRAALEEEHTSRKEKKMKQGQDLHRLLLVAYERRKDIMSCNMSERKEKLKRFEALPCSLSHRAPSMAA